jgi:hypothetical protein
MRDGGPMSWWPDESLSAFTQYEPWVLGSWLVMEVATVVVSLVALRFIQFPLLLFPLVFALWYLAIDLTEALAPRELTWNEQKTVSVVFGLIVIVWAWLADLRKQRVYAFWLYLFGLLIFCGGLTIFDGGSEYRRIIYAVVNVALLVAALILQRMAFIVFGAAGLLLYLAHLAYDVFRNSLYFPVVLSFAGISVILLGIYYHKHRQRLEGNMKKLLPPSILRLIPTAPTAD